MAKFEITIRSPRPNRSLIIPAAAALGVAFQESATAGTAELADSTVPISGFLTQPVTANGPALADHIFPGRLELPTKAGEPASLEFAEEFVAEGIGEALYSGAGNLASNTALKTKIAFKDGKPRIAQSGEFAEFILVENGMAPETANALRCRFQRIEGVVIP